MQFQVPQFIEVEDKIFGPLTFKQFVYVVGAAGGSYIIWRLLPPFLALPLIALVGGSALSLAFLQYNGRPSILAVENAFFYLIHTKFYLWNNQRRMKTGMELARAVQPGVATAQTYVPKLSESKLRDLAWSLDIKERVAGGVAREEERGADMVMPIRTARDARI